MYIYIYTQDSWPTFPNSDNCCKKCFKLYRITFVSQARSCIFCSQNEPPMTRVSVHIKNLPHRIFHLQFQFSMYILSKYATLCFYDCIYIAIHWDS